MSRPPVPSRGTVLAFDWGTRRIGVAVGELELRTSHPAGVLTRGGTQAEERALAELIDQWHPVLAVVGLPGHLDDGHTGEHPLAPRCRAFARRLETRHGLPVHLVDERLSSWAADDLLRQGGSGWRARREHVDSMAAQQILETFFELASPASRS